MPTVPGPQVDYSLRTNKVSTQGNITQAKLPRSQSLLNANVAPRVIQGGAPQATNIGTETFNQGLAEGGALRDMAATFQRVTSEIQNDVDTAVTKQADNRLSDAIRETLIDPEQGYLGTVGKSSLDSRSLAGNKINKAREDIEKTLQTDSQKAAFRQAADARIRNAYERIDTHALQQVKVYKKAESSARITAAKTDAAANWGSWNEKDTEGNMIGAFDMHKSAMMNEIQDRVEAEGFTRGSKEYRDAVQNATLAETTDLHTQVVQNMVSFGLSGEAKEYFKDAIKDGEVDPSALDTVNNLIKTGSVKEDSLNLSMQIGGTLSQQTKELESMFKNGNISAEVFDATKSRFEKTDSNRKAQAKEYESNVLEAGQDWVVKNPASSISDMPADLRNALDSTGNFASIVGYHRTNGQPDTDTNTYVGLRMMAAQDPEAFKQVDIKKARQFLNDSDFNKFVNLQAGLIENNDEVAQSTSLMNKTITALKADLASIGIDTTPTVDDKKEAQELADFQKVAFDSLDTAAAQKGAPLTEDEARDVALGLIKEAHDTKRGWFSNDGNKPAYQVTDEEIEKGEFALVPMSEIAPDDIDYLRAKFPGISNQEIVKKYSKYLRSTQ